LWGENVALRVLEHGAGVPSLEQLGFEPELLVRLRRLLLNPQGLLLVTGPTGSGKTTTLYSILEELKRPGQKILTAEDPIEYALDGAQQSQVDEAIGTWCGASWTWAWRRACWRRRCWACWASGWRGGCARGAPCRTCPPPNWCGSSSPRGCPRGHGCCGAGAARLVKARATRAASSSRSTGRRTSGGAGYWSRGLEPSALRQAALDAGFQPLLVHAARLAAEGLTSLEELRSVVPYEQICREVHYSSSPS
jgi:energy-coupling factor transporter ATP-binding protein EcfA2